MIHLDERCAARRVLKEGSHGRFQEASEAKAKLKPNNPRDIFNALPKPPGINDLYASQAEVLDAWYARREEKDVVVKLHTGGGRTLVALLMAQSVMNETDERALYLAPTNQLVEQVLAKSKEYGIAALPYTKGQPLPTEFHDGKAVLVGAYETLFNGRGKFGVRGSGQQVVKLGLQSPSERWLTTRTLCDQRPLRAPVRSA